MQELKELIHQLENHIAVENKLNAKVSKVAVGWHIDHSLRLITAVINGLKKSNPDEFKKTFSLKKKILFMESQKRHRANADFSTKIGLKSL